MIIKHEYSNILVTPKREAFSEMLTQSMMAIQKAKDTLEIMEAFNLGDIDGFDIIAELDCQLFDDIQAIKDFAFKGFSAISSNIIVARDASGHMEQFNKLIKKLSSLGLDLSEEEASDICERLTKIIAELTYVIYFEFNVEATKEQLQQHVAEKAIDVDQIIDIYVSTYGLTVEEFINEIEDTKAIYPFHLSIFDDYPDKEAPFEKLMGPLLGSLLENDKLTISLVDAVIGGVMTPEELVLKLSTEDE